MASSSSLYQTSVSSLSSFAISYFKNGEVGKSSCETKSPIGFNADSIRPPSVATHFHPDVWAGYDFSSSTTTNSELGMVKKMLEEKKNEVKDLLSLASSDPFQELDLIDKIQRLGLAYQFEVEIQDVLKRTYHDDDTSFNNKSMNDNYTDLHLVSLRFRLLRQGGYYVSPAVFNKFKDDSGEFSANLVLNVPGMLSLYEASYLGFNEEDIMDDAMAFTTNHLQSIASDPTSPLASHVQHALCTPLQHRVERLLATEYIKIYGDDITRNKTLLEYAKLDYNVVQMLHRKEITEISRWWKQININSKVPFHVRDRVVEAYAMILSFNYEPGFSLGRIHLAKLWCVLTILDDAHDVYGNLTELEPLCNALQRWDEADLNELPNHMKEVFHAMSNLLNDIDGDLKKKGHFVGGPYLKKQLQIIAKSYFDEAKVLFSTDVPTMEYWCNISLVSAGLNPFVTIAAMNMGEHATKEIFDWIESMPNFLKYTHLMTRLMDDIATYKEERKRGIIITFVTCYMKENGVSESEAVKNLKMVCMRLWKDINKECLRINNPIPLGLQNIILNFTRNLELYYGDGDGYTNSNGRTKEIITSLLIDSFAIE